MTGELETVGSRALRGGPERSPETTPETDSTKRLGALESV